MQQEPQYQQLTSPRVSSIKTRIKTHEHSSLEEQRSLREYLPLKQGLRQGCNFFIRVS